MAMPITQLDRAERLTATGVFLLRAAAGVFFLIPGVYKFIAPEAFEAMLANFPPALEPILPSLFASVPYFEVIGGLLLIAGFHLRLLMPPLVVIIVTASAFVVRFDDTSAIWMLSLAAHAMAAGLYTALFFLGGGRWALDGGRDVFAWLGRRRWGGLSAVARDLTAGVGRNTGVVLLRASIALPFLAALAVAVVNGAPAVMGAAGAHPGLNGVLAVSALLGGVSALTGFWIRRMAWVLIAATIAHALLVGVADAAQSQIGLINLLLYGLLLAALAALRLIDLGGDLEVDHVLNGALRNVVIVGGGFAGTALARRLERLLPPTHRVVVISEETYTTFNPLLAEIVGASVLPSHTIAPIRRMLRRSRFVLGHVDAVDVAARTVTYDVDGDRVTLAYDHLVFALGARANRTLIMGAAEHALPFKLIGDALALRNRVIAQMERADQSDDAAERARLGRFIVVGGGFSGVEVAGAIHDFLRGAQKHYPRLHDADLGVTVVHGTDQLLPELPAALGRHAHTSMAQRGLDIRLSARVAQVDAEGVVLSDGARIGGASVVNTIGVAPNPLIAALDLPSERGRVRVGPDMAVAGYEGLWALGDCARVPNAKDGALSPPTAQFAVRQGRHLATTIARSVAGRPTKPFAYRARGSMASVGHLNGVASLFGRITVTGLPAWLLWRAYYLSLMPTVLRRVQIFFEWTWSMLFSADIAALRFTTSREADAHDADRAPAPDIGSPA